MIVLLCSRGFVFACQMLSSPKTINQDVNHAQVITQQSGQKKQSEGITAVKKCVKNEQKSFQGPQGQQYGFSHSGYELKRWW